MGLRGLGWDWGWGGAEPGTKTKVGPQLKAGLCEPISIGSQFWALGANFRFWEANFGLWGNLGFWKPILGFGRRFGLWLKAPEV